MSVKFGTTGNHGAKIMLLGEFPSVDAVKSGIAWSGQQGRLLDQLLKQAGVSRFECLLSFVARERPPGGDMRFFFSDKQNTQPKPMLQAWLSELRQDLIEFQPNVVVCLGAFPLWAMTGEWKLSDYRGAITESTLLSGMKCIATESPYTVMRMWELTFPVVMDFRKAQRQSRFYGMPVDNRVHVSDATLNEFIDYCDFLCNDAEVDMIAADTETSRPNNHVNRMGYAHSPEFGLSFQLLEGRMPLYNENDELKIWKAIDAVAQAKKRLIYQNAPYDLSVLWSNNGILHNNLWADTMVMAHVLWPEAKRSLGFLASICLDIPAWKHTSSASPGLYNAQDCTSTIGCALVMDEQIDKFGVREIFEREMSQIPVAIFMQLRGVGIDAEVQARLLGEARAKRDDALAKLDTLTGGTVNYNSPAQLQDLLYMKLGLPVQYKRRKRATDTRKPTADAEALEKLSRETNHPILSLILEYRKWEKLRKNVSNPTSPNGRYHTSYNICSKTSKQGAKVVLNEDEGGTDTGRWSSSGSIIFPYGPGNLQNINKFAREMYVPAPGKVLIQADYIQAEAVVVAYLTNDSNLKRIFANHEDLHCFTAATMFNIPVEEIAKDSKERKIGKLLRHATNYSAGPAVVAKNLGVKMNEAKKLLELYKCANPLLATWHIRIQDELNKTRTLTTPLGRKRRFLDRWGDDLFRSAYAFLPQSTVGDLLNLSIVSLYEDTNLLHPIDIWMQLHDAIYIEVDDNPAAIRYGMEKLFHHMYREIEVKGDTMVIDVDFSIGYNWKQMADARLVDDRVETLGRDDLGNEKWEVFKCRSGL
jgi:uracil-DNA glycosylase family 4